ncbi:hypothetical protein NMG60_11025652 [Bertholletia excelsa]
MEGNASEFQDWELLPNTDDSSSVNSSSNPAENVEALEGIDGNSDSEGIIRTDYFSLESQDKYVKSVAVEADASEEGSVESDNPSWIDPAVSDTRYARKQSGEFWPDSGSDRSDDHKFSMFDGKQELGFVESAKIQVGFEGLGEIGAESGDLGKFWTDSGGIGPISMGFGDIEPENEVGVPQNGTALSAEEKGEEGSASGDGNESSAITVVKTSDEAEKKRSVVWWKIPFEFLKYCAFRVSPVWTFSVAAAVMGFVILGRRLYRMKRKSSNLSLKVTMDDKKVTQFLSRAARLNEAFSVVKRVPVIRPSLPAVGSTPWPVMSLR